MTFSPSFVRTRSLSDTFGVVRTTSMRPACSRGAELLLVELNPAGDLFAVDADDVLVGRQGFGEFDNRPGALVRLRREAVMRSGSKTPAV